MEVNEVSLGACLVAFGLAAVTGCGGAKEQPHHDAGPPADAGDGGAPAPDAPVDATPDGGGGTPFGPMGGTLQTLRFAIVGDTRPANEDDTSGYPTTIIDKIYSDIAAASPAIPFVVSTGDYMFASTYGSSSQSQPQLDLYMTARSKYPGVLFPAMGNHECNGSTDSNCGPGGYEGETANYTNFIKTMLAPIGQSNPYYSINVQGPGGAWTAKFVFIAANAWNSTQSSWLSSTLAQKSTYTFIVRHESSYANTAPGVSPSDSIIAGYPYTLLIVGHTHSYYWENPKQAIVGNGGAPLSGSGDYGYGLVTQQSDGSIAVDMIDYQTLSADSYYHKVLSP